MKLAIYRDTGMEEETFGLESKELDLGVGSSP